MDLHEKIDKVPAYLHEEVSRYIDFLLYAHQHKLEQEPKAKTFSFSWEGGLEDLQSDFTSVALQHKALEYR